ncbi:MAG: AlpA family phage regulatory protein [Nitrospira sp.]|nr:AlpA family phage regulatory protein [Nitrospira sp.]
MKILRKPAILEMTGLSDTTIWRLERKGRFPARRRISDNSVGWFEAEVEEWLNARQRGMAAAPHHHQRVHR